VREPIKVMIAVPSSGHVKAWFAHSLAGLTAQFASIKSRPDAAGHELTMGLQVTSVIHANREKLVTEALKAEATHVLFIDDDMAFDPRVLDVLLSRRHPIVCCNYPKKGFPITFTAIRPDGKAAIQTTKDSVGLEEALYTGFGMALIETRVFKAVPKPWFLPKYFPDIDTYSTEDLPFFEKATAAGFTVYVDHDASKLIGHVGEWTFRWDQAQSPEVPKAKPVETTAPAVTDASVNRLPLDVAANGRPGCPNG